MFAVPYLYILQHLLHADNHRRRSWGVLVSRHPQDMTKGCPVMVATRDLTKLLLAILVNPLLIAYSVNSEFQFVTQTSG